MSRAPKPAGPMAEQRENPFRYFPQEQVREMFNFGEDAMRSLVEMGAPVVAKKINPDHFKAWLWENRDRIGKLG